MTEYSLSICVPSKRTLEESKASISSAIGFCDSTGSELVVSDNSGNKEKSAMWNKIPLPFMKYLETCDKDTSKWSDNWFEGIKNCSGKFIGVLSDDDILVNIEKSVIDYKEISAPDIVGVKPIISLWASDPGIYKLNKYNIDGTTAIERVKQYSIAAGGNNTTYYSFFRGDILKNIYQLLKFHPTKGGYIDWAITLACVASGKVLVDGTKLLVYKNNNWYGDLDFINKQSLKLYTSCGLGEAGFHMSFLFRALDVFILIMRKNSNLPIDEKLEAAEFMLNSNLEAFINEINNNNKKGFYSKKVIDAVSNINLEESIESKLKKSLDILKIKFPSNLAADYKIFYENSIGYSWGDFY